MKSRMIVLTLVVTVVGFVTMFNQNPLYSFHQSRTTPVVIVDAQGKLLTSLFEGRTPSPFHVLFFDKNSRNFGKHSTAGVCAQKPNPKSTNWWQRLTLNASTFFLTTVYAEGCSNCASSAGTWCPNPTAMPIIVGGLGSVAVSSPAAVIATIPPNVIA